jgi:hypothetical protein
VNRKDAEDFQLEIGLLELAEDRLTQKCNINRRLGDNPKIHEQIGIINLARGQLTLLGGAIAEPERYSGHSHEDEFLGLENSSDSR